MDVTCDYIDNILCIDLWDHGTKLFTFSCTPAEFTEMREEIEEAMQEIEEAMQPHDPTHDRAVYPQTRHVQPTQNRQNIRVPSRFDGVI